MMKFKLINNEVTDEREEALTNKVAAECYYIMIAGTMACLFYGSLFNKGVISANYLLYPLLIAWIWSIYRAERLAVSAFGGSSMTVLGCLLVTALITLMIMSANYQFNHNVYHNNPLDPRYLIIGHLLIGLYIPLYFYELSYCCIGEDMRRRLEKQLTIWRMKNKIVI